MEKVTVQDAQREFSKLVDRIYQQGVSVDVERDKKVIARISPVRPGSTLKVRDLPAFLQSLPALGDDAEAFRNDLRELRREFPPEENSWD